MNIADIRTDYALKSLDEKDVTASAIDQFGVWWNEALSSKVEEVNAMTLCTVSAEGKPQGRIVLLKDYSEEGFVFFTNYESQKGKDIMRTPFASLVFFWRELQRQVRISGVVTQVSAEESDTYFHSRPQGSQLGAWASPQSQPISSREVLEANLQQLAIQYKDESIIPRPAHWGGYRVIPDSIEFWQGRSSRLHDRLLYKKENGAWRIERLAP